MSSNKKNITVFVFLAIVMISVQYNMMTIALKIQQNFTHYKVQKEIESSDLRNTFHISVLTNEINTTLRWKNNHEFFLNGFICDVVSKRIQKQFTIIEYLIDKTETKIECLLLKLNKTPDKNGKQQFVQKIKLNYISFFEEQILQTFHQNSTKTGYCFQEDFYLSHILSPPVPPPNVC